MIIVSSTYFLRNLRGLDFFTLDFGKSRKIVGSTKDEFRKLDDFTIKYKRLFNRDILKFGRIGDRINFYEDVRMENDSYIIFKDDDIYEITFKKEDIVDLKNYILETLRKIDDFETEEKQTEDKNQNIINEQLKNEENWIATDEKNNGKRYSIDQTLSREEYRKQIKKKFLQKNN